jgi:hypothetical protein
VKALATAAEQAVPMNRFVTHAADPMPVYGDPLETALLLVLYVLPGLALAIVLNRKCSQWFVGLRAILGATFPVLFWPICIHWLLYFLMPNDHTFVERMSSLLEGAFFDGILTPFAPAMIFIVLATLWDDRTLKLRSKASRFAEVP